MRLFRRRYRGRHALGAAVTAIPSAPVTVAAAAPAPPPWEAPVLPGEAPAPAAPRVQLGFRDGSSTALDPRSTQSLALEQLAQALTRRD